jgi:hypothetical protein
VFSLFSSFIIRFSVGVVVVVVVIVVVAEYKTETAAYTMT